MHLICSAFNGGIVTSSVGGIDCGRRLKVEGLVCFAGGQPTIYNPRYELAPRPGE